MKAMQINKNIGYVGCREQNLWIKKYETNTDYNRYLHCQFKSCYRP